MLQYTIKRLLLTIPTILFISLLLFLVLNIAPGRPGAAIRATRREHPAGTERKLPDLQGAVQPRQAHPPQHAVRKHAGRGSELAGGCPTTCKARPAAERIEAQETLDDHGNYLVRHLVPLLGDSDAAVREVANNTLVAASQLRFVSERRGDIDAAREQNRVISKRNQVVKDWIWDGDLTEAEQAELAGKWTAWYAEHEGDYTYTTNDKVNAFFFDTRFAKYWSNLIHLDFGVSTADRRPVFETVLSKLKYSLSLTFISVILAYSIAVPIGVFSAIRQGTRLDSAVTVVLFVMYSLPTFFTGTVLLRLLTEGESRSRGSPRATFRR